MGLVYLSLAPCMREAGIDYPGNDIRMEGALNIENCEQACRGEKTCVGTFVFQCFFVVVDIFIVVLYRAVQNNKSS